MMVLLAMPFDRDTGILSSTLKKDSNTGGTPTAGGNRLSAMGNEYIE